MGLCGVSDVALGMIERLELGRWHVADSAMEAPMIPPVDPLCGGELHLLKRSPGSALADDLGLVQAVTASARALSYESPCKPTERTAPASSSRSV